MVDPKDEIKQRVDIVDLIGEYVQLKQGGAVSFKGLCPFHGEKTPSFHVSRDKQIWHCFGCSEGGDCFAFLMKMEGMDFPEALRHLGAKVGIEVKRFSTTQSNEKQRLFAINELAAKYYRKVLCDSTAAVVAREYLAKRGISEALCTTFNIGFAPDGWDALALFLAKRGFPETEGERSGLLMRRRQGSGMIDRFRNRIMIPLRDHHGNTVGFTGRSMPGASDEAGAKYMNSPETPVYHKGSLLFGLDLAKRAIKDKSGVIIVEGNLDVVASHKAGVENVVASSGTALTEDQLALLKRYTTTLVFSFDSDAAGFKAAHRGITLASQMGFDVRAAVLPSTAGKDPDEAVQKDPELWRRAVTQPVPIMQYYIDRAVSGRDLGNVDDKRAISAFLRPELARIPDAVEREHWLQVVADLLHTNVGVMRQEITRALTPSPSPLKRGRSATFPLLSKEGGGVVADRHSKEEQAALLLMGLFVQDDSVRTEILSEMSEPVLPVGPVLNLYKELAAEYHQDHSSVPQQSFFGRLRGRLEAHADRETLIPIFDTACLRAEQLAPEASSAQVRGHVRQLSSILKADDLLRRRKVFEADLRRAESAGDREAVQRLLREFKDLR